MNAKLKTLEVGIILITAPFPNKILQIVSFVCLALEFNFLVDLFIDGICRLTQCHKSSDSYLFTT